MNVPSHVDLPHRLFGNAFLWFTPIGAILSATCVWLLALYHNKLIHGE
jgi:hypothetical protein